MKKNKIKEISQEEIINNDLEELGIDNLSEEDYSELLTLLTSKSDFNAGLPFEIDTTNPIYLKIDSKYYTTLNMKTLANRFSLNALNPLLLPNDNQLTKISFSKTPVEKIKKVLNKDILDLQVKIRQHEEGKHVLAATEYDEIKAKRDSLSAQSQQLNSSSLYYNVNLKTILKDENKDKLKVRVQNLIKNQRNNNFNLEGEYSDMLLGHIESTAFNSARDKQSEHILNEDELSLFLPYRQKNKLDKDGQMLGVDLNSEDEGQVVMHNLFSKPALDSAEIDNENLLISGSTGTGKSFLAATYMLHAIDMGARICILDSENQFKHLTKELGGINITFNPRQDFPINFLDIKESFRLDANGIPTNIKEVDMLDYKKESLEFLQSIYRISEGHPMHANEINAMSAALTILLYQLKINEDPASLYFKDARGKLQKKTMPQISTLVETLYMLMNIEKLKDTNTPVGNLVREILNNASIENYYQRNGFKKEDVEKLFSIFKDYSKKRGGTNSKFDVQTDYTSDLYNWDKYSMINLDIGRIIASLGDNDDENDASLTLIIQILSKYMKKDFYNRRLDLKKVLFIDESWRYMKKVASWQIAVASVIEDAIKTIRKRNGAIWQATQNIYEYNTDTGKTILGNIKSFIVLAPGDDDIDFLLTQGVSEYQLRALQENKDRKIKGRYYVRLGSQWYYLENAVSDYEVKLIDTSLNKNRVEERESLEARELNN